MPTRMKIEFEQMNAKEKMKFLYSCFSGKTITEWNQVYIAIVDFIYNVTRSWYENIDK